MQFNEYLILLCSITRVFVDSIVKGFDKSIVLAEKVGASKKLCWNLFRKVISGD
jgi:hypothetical protein